jgi:hypothetical protein
MRAYHKTAVRLSLTALMTFAGNGIVSARQINEAVVAAREINTVVLRIVPIVPAWRSASTRLGLDGSFVALQSLDVVSTLRALGAPGAHEANPVMAPWSITPRRSSR